MHATAHSALLLAVLSGSAAANIDPIQLDPTAANIRHVGHIYYNIATGEKITTIFDNGDSQQPANGTEGTQIWIADTGAQCADAGFSTSNFFTLSDPNSGCSGTSCDLEYALIDWGEIEPDTVVDCVQIHWITDHPDTDFDSDSQADGVPGFAARWTYWDAVGSAPVEVVEEVATPIIDLMFFALPGEYPPSEESVSFYTADIDLGATFASSLRFEIGDSDGDKQGAEFHNALMSMRDVNSDSIPDFDYNENGLADWGWSISFIQPGSADVDNQDSDSDPMTGIDGDLSNQALAGVVIASPTPGHAEYDSVEDRWDWVSDGPTAGLTDDAFILALALDPLGQQLGPFAGPFNFGGLDCSPEPNESYTPAAHFMITLYGPGAPGDSEACNIVDLNGDGSFSFIDISLFFQYYENRDPRIDIAGHPDGGPDGRINMFDISGFLMYLRLCQGI